MKIKISDFLDAVDKNGYPWVRTWSSRIWEDNETRFGKMGYCVMSQAGINLGIAVPDEDGNLGIHATDQLSDLNSALKELAGGKSIIGFNDEDAESYEDAKEYAHTMYDRFRNHVVEVSDIPEYDGD